MTRKRIAREPNELFCEACGGKVVAGTPEDYDGGLISDLDWLASCTKQRLEIVSGEDIANEIWCGQYLLGSGAFLREAIAEAVKCVNTEGDVTFPGERGRR